MQIIIKRNMPCLNPNRYFHLTLEYGVQNLYMDTLVDNSTIREIKHYNQRLKVINP